MAFCLDFNIRANTQETLSRLLAEARKVGVHIEGDDQQGSFSGHQARGHYQIHGQRLTITVTEKPWLFPEAMIRNVARERAPEWGLEAAWRPTDRPSSSA